MELESEKLSKQTSTSGVLNPGQARAHAELRSLPLPIIVWALVTVALWVACLGLMGYWRYTRHLPYPWNFPFFPVDHLYDIWCLTPRFHHVHSKAFYSPSYGFLLEYPAPAGLFYLWEIAFGHEFITFFASAAFGLICLGVLFGRKLSIAGLSRSKTAFLLIFTALFSYTLWYEGVQANIEVFLFFIIASGAIAYLDKRWNVAAALFGVAASMKLFPFILLALFVPKKRWRAIATGAFSAILSLLIGLWVLCPDIAFAWRQMLYGLSLQRDKITLFFDDKAIGFDHSIFGLIKILTEHHFNRIHPVVFPGWLLRNYVLTVALLGTGLWAAKIRKLPLLNQISCLVICSVLLPPTSYEYTLLHMYIPWGLLVLYTVRCQRDGMDVKPLVPAFICFAVLFAPMSELIFKKVNLGAPTLKCGSLVLLLFIFLLKPMPGLEGIWNNETPSLPTD